MDINLKPLSGLEPIKIDPQSACGQLEHVLSMLSAFKRGLWEHDAQSGQLHFLNDYRHILGLERVGGDFSTLAGLRAVVHPDDLKAMEVAFSSVSTTASVRYRMVAPDGTEIWLRDRYAVTDEPGKIMCSTVNAEIEEGKGEQFRRLMDAMTDFIFVWDKDFYFVDVLLPEGVRLFHSREELLGADGRTLYSPEVADLLSTNVRETLRTGRIREVEYHTDVFDKRFYWQARMVPVDGRVYAIHRDIGTKIESVEKLLAAGRKAEESDSLKSAFLANMSHEIRTPLNAIVGFTEVVAAEDDPEARQSYMDIIRSNSDLLMQLINDILDLSRIESGKSEMKFDSIEVNALVDDIGRTHSIKMKPGVELRTFVLPEETQVYTDRNRVTQILFNFLSNAIKNTDEGSITLRVEPEGNYLRFAVEDTGRGIPEDKLATIFHRFEKLNESVQGTGLGLSICQSLAERLGGEIGVESTFGQGSTFWFTLPYRHKVQETVPGEPKDGTRPVILAAEESDEDFDRMREILGGDYDLIRAHNGEEALGSFVTEKPALVLLSIRMNVMNGIEAAKRIRAISPTTPIVAMTDNDFYMEQRWALESGCNDVISKPFSATQLTTVVASLV